MDIGTIVGEYFVDPIWEKSGYNPVNTLAYALIAFTSVYLIHLIMRRKNVEVGDEFVAGALAFTLFGSSLRVITDSVSTGTMQRFVSDGASGPFGFIANSLYPRILSSHLLDYGYLTVSPGIYILTAMLFLSTFALGMKLGRMRLAAYAGAAGAAINLLVLLPMFVNWGYALIIVVLVLLAAGFTYVALKFRSFWELAPLSGQALDGAATWVTIDWFSAMTGVVYGEQHVVTSLIGNATPLGYGLFFVIKVVFSAAAVHALREDIDPQMRKMALLVIMIIGLAPGLRDMLRLLAGT